MYISLLLVEFTSIPLLLICFIYLLTGYQMINPSLLLFPRALSIHTDETLRVLFLLLTTIHSMTGLLLMCERRIRTKTIRVIAEGVIVVILIALTIFLLTLDLIY